MKTRFFALCFSLALYGQVHSQVAKWLIEPEWESIKKQQFADVLKTSTGGSTIIWSMNGEKLINTKDYVAPFHEGLAVSTEYKGNIPTTAIKGIYTEEGKFTPVNGNYALFDKEQLFHSRHLLVKDKKDDAVFRYMSPDGSVSNEKFIEAMPFRNGYASCETYEKWEKKKGRYPLLLNEDMKHMRMEYGGKDFDNDDISFISSINDEGIGIVVAKEKVFYYSGKNGSLSPLYASEQEQNPKNQAEVKGALLSLDEQGQTILRARTHKSGQEVIVSFDELLMPLSVKSSEMNREFLKKALPKWKPDTPLSLTLNQNLYGIVLNDTTEVLPPQFKKVELYGNNAIVELHNGKYGVLQIIDKSFSLKLNKGEAIPFKHRRFQTVVYLDMPKDISPENVTLISNDEYGCNIDVLSKTQRVTESGNRIQYDCTLNFPKSLPDEMLYNENNKLKYPVQIQYHGLMSPIMTLETLAWHYKYFDLETTDVQVSKEGTATFQLNILIPSADDQNYSLQVGIASSDTLTTEIHSSSVFKHKCSVSPLKEGINNFDIIVQEDGCPPITLPFELTYTKPAPRKRESGKVSIIQKIKPEQKKFVPKT